MKPICIIPARYGSKRLAKKNFKKLFGQPIIARVIKNLIKTKLFSKIIVSTDSDIIKKISMTAGAIVPFIRPKKLANDFVGINEVMSHAVNFLKKKGETFNEACCVFPTAVLVNTKDLRKSHKIFLKHRSNYLFSATVSTLNFQRSFFFKNKKLKMFFPSKYKIRTQDLTVAYQDAGQFYWGSKKNWGMNKKIFTINAKIFLLEKYKTIDVDTKEDWKILETFYSKMIKGN